MVKKIIEEEWTPSQTKVVRSWVRHKPKRWPQYTSEEDNVIIEGFKRFGNDIIQLATLLPKRSMPSVKARVCYLRRTATNSKFKLLHENKRTKRIWTDEETELLISLCQKMNSYASKMVEYFPGKTAREIYDKIRILRNE